METVVAVEGGEEVKFEDIAVSNTSSGASFQKDIANPIVYKLVRVEGDGRLVPATDDEVMEVENLLEDDKSEMHFVTDADQIAGCTSNCEVLSEETTLNSSKGSEDLKADGKKSNAPHDTALDLEKSNVQFEEIVPLSATRSNDNYTGQSGDEDCLEPPCALTESVASTSTLCTSLKPDFSKLKGEICLDNLSVKELHETFRATFGRETSVKDKQWLKRRISMGLSNSCDVSATTFLIQDNRVVKKEKAESCKAIVGFVAKEPLVRGVNNECGDLSVSRGNQMENQLNIYGKKEENADLKKHVDDEDLHGKQRAAKRVRKPTKRYIEEVSELDSREYSGKLISPILNSGHGQLSTRALVRPVQNVQSVSKPLVTRQDSLGGSGVQVPYVSRIRRGRPRENFMALMKLQPSGMGMAAKQVQKSLTECDQRSDIEVGNNVFKARLAPGWLQKPLINEPEKDELYLERKTTEVETDVDSGNMDSSGDNSDDNIVTVPTSKGGMRRKHHRPWSLREVVKLVEGVARYGAGRWSEIKKIAFSSYSYRTSVDLKDKWRNLIRASFAQLPAEKGVQNSRKHASMAIPAPILLRVKELAEMQSQVAPDLTSMKFVGHSGRSVHETRAGYL